MNPEIAIATILGLLAGLFVSTVWYSVRWTEEHRKAVASDAENVGLKAHIVELERAVYPHQWVDSDDPEAQQLGRDRMHARYPDLIRPDTEVIRIDGELPEPEPWQDVPAEGSHE